MKDSTMLTPEERNAIEAGLNLDDHNATGSPVEPIKKTDLDAAREGLERERRLGLLPGWCLAFFPKVLPVGWQPLDRLQNAERWMHQDGMLVIISAAVEQDNKRWLHVSCSYQHVLPNWKDLGRVKKLFIGRNRTAIQFLPAESKYINQHPYVLHLFACLDEEPFPDFTHGTGHI